MKKQIFYLFLWLAIPMQAQWTQQNSGTTENLNDVFCISADTVVVAGDNATILRTTNGGTDWLTISNPAAVNLHKVQFADTQTGYAVGDAGTLLKTTDAGVTWQALTTNTTENLLALHVKSIDTLYVAGTNGLIMKSANGGNSWININSNTTDIIYEVQFFNHTGYYMIGDWLIGNSELHKTIDNGNSWNIINSNSGYISSFLFNNENVGIIGLGSGAMQLTYDGCNTFNTTDNTFGCTTINIDVVNNDIWSVGKPPQTTGSNSGDNYRIAKTSINNSYQTSYYGSDNVLSSIDFWNNQIGYVVGFDYTNSAGLILKNITGENPSNSIKTLKNNMVRVLPNPSNGQFTIQSTANNIKPISYIITDLQGKEVVPNTIINGNIITAIQLSNGIYLLKLKDHDNIYTKKLIIQK